MPFPNFEFQKFKFETKISGNWGDIEEALKRNFERKSSVTPKFNSMARGILKVAKSIKRDFSKI